MYRTRQFHIKKNSRLYPYCRDLCSKSTSLYNRANFVIRQYATAVGSFGSMKPLYDNQMQVFRLVYDILSSTKYLGDNKWLSYNAIDRVLKVSKDKAYYALPAQANQQVLKLLLRDYKSFFEAIKVYKSNPAAFTGQPRLPKYIKENGLKTAILTNQICTVKDDKYLKLPDIKTRLNLGMSVGDGSLKEVRIKPAGDRFVIDVVLDMEDTGITPLDNDIILKELARLSSAAMLCNGRHRTKRMNELTGKRNRRIKDQFHKISRQIADYARDNHVDVVIMGHNVFQKQEIDIGHVNNQNFVQIPMTIFAGMLKYKLAAYGIRFVTTEESYTSKADFIAGDRIPVYRKDDRITYIFSGERIKRGLYRHCDGTVNNADINGAANILRKVFPKVTQWDRGIVDMPCSAGYTIPAGSCHLAA